jgi:hypothetical protein
MRKVIMGTVLALSLAFAGTAQADTNVQSLTGDWRTTNSTVTKVADGVHFGTYADGSALSGSLIYENETLRGLKLKDVKDLSYTFNYKEAGTTVGAAPYLRIFLDSDNDGFYDSDVDFEPSFCGTVIPEQKTQKHQMVGNSVRYNDDGCGDPGATEPGNQPWDNVVANHGDERIVFIAVSQGFSTGKDVSALLKQITFNGEKFNFDVPPADGQDGQKGAKGDTGAQGATGLQGPKGDQGPAGPVVVSNADASVVAGGPQRGSVSIASRALTVSKTGKVRVNVDCFDGGLCQGRVLLRSGSKIVGRGTFIVRGGDTAKVSVRLSKRALERVRSGSLKNVRVHVSSRDLADRPAKAARTLRIAAQG